MIDKLKSAIEQSDTTRSREVVTSLLEKERRDPWAIHESMYNVVQQVLNPPFKNPHLPKMYAINRELAAYLVDEDKAQLVKLEVEEYARRAKLEVTEKPAALPNISVFADVERTIADHGPAETTAAMAAFVKKEGREEFARRLLLLGSGYLDSSLGHSISCTAFILLEMIRRQDQDIWPTLALLADYFCKGTFKITPELQSFIIPSSAKEAYWYQLGRAVSGTGIAALHHTITFYAIERSGHLFTTPEHDHLLAMCRAMMKEKKEDLYRSYETGVVKLSTFEDFYSVFAEKNPQRLLPFINGALPSANGRTCLARYIIKAVLQSYNGSYNPHNLTGLGSALWLMEQFHQQPIIVGNGWMQYFDYFFSEIG